MNTFPPKHTSLQQAQEELRQHPYYLLPALQAIKQAAPGEQIPDELLRRVAISFSSMEDISNILGQQASIFDNFYPDERRSTPGTMDTIDTFLSNFGSADPHEAEALEKLIFSSTPDYGAVLAAEEKNSLPTEEELQDPNLSEQDRLINSFISASHAPTPAVKAEEQEQPLQSTQSTQSPLSTQKDQKPQPTPKAPEYSSLTEGLVRILIKNRNYSKAIEIISELSLNNPKKSIYFADQIRFLKKLIINENKKIE